MAIVVEHLAGHGGGYVAAQRAGQRVLDQRPIVGGDVVGDDEDGLLDLLRQVRRAFHSRAGKEPYQRANGGFNERVANPGEGSMPGPIGVNVVAARGFDGHGTV